MTDNTTPSAEENPQTKMKNALRNIELSIKSIPNLITRFNLKGKSKLACERLGQKLHDEYERLVVCGDIARAYPTLRELKDICNSEMKKSMLVFKDNSRFFDDYLKPIMNCIMSSINCLIELFTANKKYHFTHFQTKSEVLQSTWNDIQSDFSIAIRSASDMGLFKP